MPVLAHVFEIMLACMYDDANVIIVSYMLFFTMHHLTFTLQYNKSHLHYNTIINYRKTRDNNTNLQVAPCQRSRRP